jgi:hypothetical protein
VVTAAGSGLAVVALLYHLTSDDMHASEIPAFLVPPLVAIGPAALLWRTDELTVLHREIAKIALLKKLTDLSPSSTLEQGLSGTPGTGHSAHDSGSLPSIGDSTPESVRPSEPTAPPKPGPLPFIRLWWTCTWPLLVTVILANAAGAKATGGPVMLWGIVFAGMFSARPEVDFSTAFRRALLASLPIHLGLTALLYVLTERVVKVVFGGASMPEALVSSGTVALVWSALAAFFAVRKTRRIAAASVVPMKPPPTAPSGTGASA